MRQRRCAPEAIEETKPGLTGAQAINFDTAHSVLGAHLGAQGVLIEARHRIEIFCRTFHERCAVLS